MPTPVPGSPTSTRSAPRHQARSAGMAERPTRNENLTDLVRFFQTQNMPSDTTPTALPAVESPNREQQQQLKPLHRRLLQFTQRQKKDSSKPKVDENQKQIEALQREGYLIPAPKPKEPKEPKGSLDQSKSSLDRSLSTSKKKDVETIGQPWLDNSDGKKGPEARRRLASLDLGDFGSMVDVAVSLSEFDDSVPPPYRPSSSTEDASQNDQNAASQSTSALPLPRSSSEGRSSSFDRPMSPISSPIDAEPSVSRVDFAHRRSASSSSLRIVDPDTNPPKPATEPPASVHTIESSDQSMKSESKAEQDLGPPPETPNRPPPHPPTSNTPSLKLFPDVAPPRMSSKNAWRLSAAPRYQTAPVVGVTTSSSSRTDTAGPVKSSVKSSVKSQPSHTRSANDLRGDAGPVSSGAVVTDAVSTTSGAAKVTTSKRTVQITRKTRPPSLAMGTLKAFPLPAPTKPLPSIPKKGPAPPATPDAKPNATLRPVRSGLKVPEFLPSKPSPIAEDPYELEPRPATAMGHVGSEETEADDDDPRSLDTTPERPKSASPESNTPKRRAASARMSHMQNLPESPSEHMDGQSRDGQPVADSPVLGQMTPTKPHGKRTARKGLHINPRSDSKNLPFGLPSPPPTAPLPSDPPAYPPPDRPLQHRNYTAPMAPGVQSAKGLEMAFGPALHRGSMISRSNSSRSSLRHESIPETYEPSQPESPLPSSDDEAFGPGVGASRPRRTTEKRNPPAKPTRHAYEKLDARAGHSRPRYPHPLRPLTPQSRSCHSLDKTASPQSQYSQSTYRSRESASHQRTPQVAKDGSSLLEDRVANLERQNQILQAALMAALNAGVKNPMEDLQGSMSPASSGMGPSNAYQGRFASRPESWVSSSRSSEHSGFETPASLRDSRANNRQLDNMIEDIEAGWLSDKSSLSGARSMTRRR